MRGEEGRAVLIGLATAASVRTTNFSLLASGLHPSVCPLASQLLSPSLLPSPGFLPASYCHHLLASFFSVIGAMLLSFNGAPSQNKVQH